MTSLISRNVHNYMTCKCKCVLILSSSFSFYSGASVHKAYAGESEKVLREAFSKAASEAATGKPAIIFIDEIDTMCPPRDSRYSNDADSTAFLGVYFRHGRLMALLRLLKMTMFSESLDKSSH